MSQNLTWVEISKSALKHNIGIFKKKLSSKTSLMTVVKSNAYGHGMLEFAKLAIEYGSDWLGVVNLSEAVELRKTKIKAPILVLSYYDLDENDIEFAAGNSISLVVYSLEQASFINKIAQKNNQKYKVHLKIDTGTSRLGILSDEALNFVIEIAKFKNIEIEGIFSHFAASEENQQFTKLQLKRFESLIDEIEKLGIEIKYKHFACSAAIISQLESHFNLVRLGISAYGLWPSTQAKKLAQKNFGKNFDLRPVMSLYTKIVQLKNIPAGSCIGYGCTAKVKKKTKIAILPIGYNEGFDRHLSNSGEVIIADKKCKILGRICMNLCMVDVNKIKNIKVGDKVTLIGKSKSQQITADDLAKKIGTINYEVVTRINPNILRKYV